ncbi:hypothetical protein lbkm_4222 [Lachnospiraceae bacterium KM106-2]|nr:hypothetical protein lbkm_4222 [Lachnospiraceae bacterium KM106-2]
MDISSAFDCLARYGALFIFVIIFLEYLNVPGLAAAIVMPAVGIWCAKSGMNLIFAIFISVLGGLTASWILYFLGVFFGDVFMNRYLSKHPKQKEFIDKKVIYIREKGNAGVFIARFIPAVRTLISIPAGLVKLNFISFTAYSVVAITIYNAAFISAGYFMGAGALQLFA